MGLWLNILVAVIAVLFLLIKLVQYNLDQEFTAKRNSHHKYRSLLLSPPNPERPLPPSSSVLHIYKHAAICSDCTVCSNVGRDILSNASSSAVDAAIATLLCNGLLGMQSMGIGGGVLLNVYSRQEQRAYSILARELAPLRVNKSVDADAYSLSALSIGVPTEVMGYAVAHERFGKLSWQQLIAPTLDICRHGYTLSKHQYDALHMNTDLLVQNDLLRKMFWNDTTQRAHRPGTHVQPPAILCRTYELLAANGPRSFYTGTLAPLIAADLEELGSPITLEDLRSVQVQIVASPTMNLSKHTLHFTPPPGSGAIVALAINILHQLRDRFWRHDGFAAEDIHRIIEALKFAFVQRWKLDAVTTEEYLRYMTSTDFALQCTNLLNENNTLPDASHYLATEEFYPKTEFGTTHISVLAPNGDAVAATTSINFYFGSGRSGNRTGILFNNAMADFSIKGLHNYFNLPYSPQRNGIRPGLSPMSSMSPLIVTDSEGYVRLVVGAAGGTKIISVLTQILVRTLWMNLDIKRAIDEPRFHHQMSPDVIEYEYGIVDTIIQALEQKLHKTLRYRERGSAVCGIERRHDIIYANADYRKEGGTAGF